MRTNCLSFAARGCALMTILVGAARAENCVDSPPTTPYVELCHTSFSVLLDNDTLLLNSARNEDRNYTMGLAFHWSGRWVHEKGLTKPLEWMNSLLPSALMEVEAGSTTTHSLRFGNVAFTPDRLNTPRPLRFDRPYSSLLSFDVSKQWIAPDLQHARTTELSIGYLGLSISKRFQRWLHKKMQDSPDEPPFPPEGWHNQISNGGELTARYTMRWQKQLLNPELKERADFQVIGEGSVGYHTNVAAGAAMRVGKIVSPWWQFSMEPIPAAQGADEVPVRCHALEKGSGSELFGWAGAMGRAWGYNVLLQGQFEHSEVKVPSDRIERFIYDYGAGVTAGRCIRKHWHRLTISYSRRSPEFDGPLRRYHSWGGIYYSIAMQP